MSSAQNKGITSTELHGPELAGKAEIIQRNMQNHDKAGDRGTAWCLSHLCLKRSMSPLRAKVGSEYTALSEEEPRGVCG